MSFFDGRTAELAGKFPASGPFAVELIPDSGTLPGPLTMWVQPWTLTEPDPGEAILTFNGAPNGANWIFTTPDISPLNRVSGRIVLAVGGVPVAAGYVIGSVDSTMTRHETLTVAAGPVGITLTVSTPGPPGSTTLAGLTDFDSTGDPGDVVTLQADGTYALEPSSGGGGAAVWGSIGGAIGDQTDLANVLAAKADLVGGKIVSSQIPNMAITETFVVASQVAMLALTCETGDVAVRTDLSKTFILQGADPSVLSDWVELAAPAGGVQTVNGQAGNVVLSPGDVGAAAASHSHTADDIAAHYTAGT